MPLGKTAQQKAYANVAGLFLLRLVAFNLMHRGLVSREKQQHPQTYMASHLSTCLHKPGGRRGVLSPSVDAGLVLTPEETRLHMLDQPSAPELGVLAFPFEVLPHPVCSEDIASKHHLQERSTRKADFSRSFASPPSHSVKLRRCLSSPVLHNKPPGP